MNLDAALIAWLATCNAVGFVAVVADKRRARRNAARVPEAVFHVMALLGAWPLEALGFWLARHKVRKGRFLALFACASLANIGVLVWWNQVSGWPASA